MPSLVRTAIQSRWDLQPVPGGTAVVIDVLRFSTTVCALLAVGREDIRVTDTPESLPKSPGLKSADVFSEIDFKFPGRHFDNSPDLAMRHGRSSRIAYVTTTTGSMALFASRRASRVLIGGFANFDAVLELLRKARGRIWFVPAAPPIRPRNIEDELCARAFIEALQGREDAAAKALALLKRSPRISEFFALKLRTGRKDLAYCLGVNGMPVVPEAVFPSKSSGNGAARLVRIRRAR